ncbi:hypothetical protein ACM66B_005303 [Microbotryomycetes sp. NB124-2]
MEPIFVHERAFLWRPQSCRDRLGSVIWQYRAVPLQDGDGRSNFANKYICPPFFTYSQGNRFEELGALSAPTPEALRVRFFAVMYAELLCERYPNATHFSMWNTWNGHYPEGEELWHIQSDIEAILQDHEYLRGFAMRLEEDSQTSRRPKLMFRRTLSNHLNTNHEWAFPAGEAPPVYNMQRSR